MWIYLGLMSAVLLGIYDVFKKHAVHGNAVIPVLFISTLTGCLMWVPFLLISWFQPDLLTGSLFLVPPIDLMAHGRLFIKAVIVATSWIFAYFAMKHLPISIAAPIRASQPIWTLMGAILLFHEAPLTTQWIGMGITLTAYVAFSIVGNMEGITFHRNKWIGFMVLATLIGAVSALYDKFLMRLYPTAVVQSWFSVYLVVVLAPVLFLAWWPNRKNTTPFQWRWSIPMIGVTLILADFVYFQALRDPQSMISVLSTVRRSNVVVSFLVGAAVFRDANRGWKALCLVGILAGLIVIALGKK